MANEIRFGESFDPDHFKQYVALRRRAFFRRYPQLPATFGLPDDYDRTSRIVYALQGDVVLGGARLTLSTPDHPRSLPLEDSAFRLREYEPLRHVPLDHLAYAEISRMAVEAPSLKCGMRVSLGITERLCRIAADSGVDHIFGICPDEAADLNARNARSLGLHFAKYPKIATDYGIDMSLCMFTGTAGFRWSPIAASFIPLLAAGAHFTGKAVVILAALISFASFAWGMARHFRRAGRPSALLIAIALAAPVSAILQIFALSRMPLRWPWLALALYAASAALFWGAVSVTRGKLNACGQAPGADRVVVEGPYRLMRHPFYAAYNLAWIAGFAATTWWPLALSAVLMSCLYGCAAGKEERALLSGRLGSEYRRYRGTVPIRSIKR